MSAPKWAPGSREAPPSVLEQNGSASGLLCESNLDLCGPGPEPGELPRPLAPSGDPGSPSPRAQQVAKDIIAVLIGPTSRRGRRCGWFRALCRTTYMPDDA